MNKRFTFGGINRAVSDYDNGGALEELINLRPDGRGNFSPVRGKTYVEALEGSSSGSSWTFIGCHDWGGGVNRLFMSSTGILLYSNDSVTKQPLTSTSPYTVTAGSACIMGSMVVVSDTARGKIRAFEVSAADGTYTEKNTDAPTVTASVAFEDDTILELSDSIDIEINDYFDLANGPTDKLLALIESRMNVLHAKNSDVCLGMVLVALQFRLRDGNPWFTERIIPVFPYHASSTFKHAALTWETGVGYTMENGVLTVYANGAKLKLSVTASSWLNEFVECIDVYCTNPIMEKGSYRDWVIGTEIAGFTYNNKSLADMMQEQGIFHKVTSISREAALAGSTVSLFFGDKLQASPVMDVDQGFAVHTGKMMSYNSRIHSYAGKNNIHPCTATGLRLSRSSTTVSTAYMKMNVSGADNVMKSTSAVIPTSAGIVIYPDSRCAVLSTGSGAGAAIKMRASERYNFAWGESGETTTGFTTTSTFVSSPERNSVNVSRQNIPFAFDVKNSYAMPSSIRDMVPSVVPISEYQAGVYPIHIFTDVGVFAMQHGDGDTLYSSVIPVSEYTADSNVISTPYGKMFITRGGLYLLNGTHTELLSAAMIGGPHKEVYADSSQTAYLGATTYFSTIPFEEFCSNGTTTKCHVAFDPLHMEVIVSNTGKAYSYAFSFLTKTWHKMTGSYKGTSDMNYAVMGTGLYDMRADNTTIKTVNAWLLSRPFFIEEMQYTHIDRLCMECRTSLDALIVSGGAPQYGRAKLSVFGSNNLIEWTLVTASLKMFEIAESISQIRPERPHRSWKYYAVGIYLENVPAMSTTTISNAAVSPAQIGSLIADYHVSRKNIG